MRVEAPAIGVDDGRCKSNPLAGCGAAVVHDLGNIRRMRAGRGLVGTPLRTGGEVFLVGAQIGIRVAVHRRAHGGKTGGRIRIGMPVKEHAAEQRVKVAVIDAAQAKRQQRNIGHRVALGHKIAALKLHCGHAFQAPIQAGMLAKLESLGLVLVDLAIAIEHIARHEGAVTLREILCRPGSLKQRQRIGLSHLGVNVAAIHIGHAPKDELGKKLAPMVEPRIVLPHTIGNAHHTHLLIDTLLYGGPFGCGAIALSNTHKRTNDGVHTAPTEQPKPTRIII